MASGGALVIADTMARAVGYAGRVLVGNRLVSPDGTSAILFDMDGVLLDSLQTDYDVVSELLGRHLSTPVAVPREIVRKYFAYALPKFWRHIAADLRIDLDDRRIESLVADHSAARAVASILVHVGVPGLLRACREQGLRTAVVSNNPEAEIRRMLAGAGLLADFEVIVGNDAEGLAETKPAPDIYLIAARRLSLPPESCVAIEDSLLGAEAATRAGCYTIGVATGASSFEDLVASPYVRDVYLALDQPSVSLSPGDPTRKILESPNEFVSHMVEHIAWRLGCSIELRWFDEDWARLGYNLGRAVLDIPRLRDGAATLGMIDDGSCEVSARVVPLVPSVPDAADAPAARPGVTFASFATVDLDWFFSLRCEQLKSGYPLVELADGLARGAQVALDVKVASLEDPHHTWEGIYRAIGITLEKLTRPAGTETRDAPDPVSGVGLDTVATGKDGSAAQSTPQRQVEKGWTVGAVSSSGAAVRRETAESVVNVAVSLGTGQLRLRLVTGGSIDVRGANDLLAEFAEGSGLDLDIDFFATEISSSHVVMEDIGLALGHAIRRISVERMMDFGIYGAGSSVESDADLASKPVRVGLSVEGRKFWRFVPLNGDYADLRKSFLVGHTLKNGLFTEDLDDFVDGFSGGLGASLMFHVDQVAPLDVAWRVAFRGLGESMAEALSRNPRRKALAPGVKATLA